MAKDQIKGIQKQFAKIWRRSAIEELDSLPDFDAEAWLATAQEHVAQISKDAPPLNETPASLKISLLGAINMMACHKALLEKNVPAETSKQLCERILRKEVDRIPSVLRRLSSWFLFTGTAEKMTRHYADKLQSAGPNQYKMDFVEKDAGSFGINITQCPICHIAKKNDMTSFVPSECAIDAMLSDALGWGLKRTQTIASGAEHCDFVFRKGQSTEVLK